MSDPIDETRAPRIFTKEITVPPAWPWEQAKMALLEAQQGAPAPLDTLTIRLVRLGGWRFSTPGRYLTGYARNSDMTGVLTSHPLVDGRVRTLQFETLAMQGERRRWRILSLVILLGCCVALAWGLSLCLQMRSDTETALANAEQRQAAQVKAEHRAASLQRQSQALLEARVAGTDLNAVLMNLADVSRRGAPGVRIEAFRWRPEITALETLGPALPISSPPLLRKAPRPVRPGIYLWGEPRSSSGDGGAPGR